MVKIRYAELPVGLHVSTQRLGRDTIIYLQPGLTAAERRAALARVRNSGRIGHVPPLSPAGLARAASADKVRTTGRNGVAAMRRHPLLLLPPMIVLVSTAVFAPMSFVTDTDNQHEPTIAQPAGLVVTPGRAPAHRGASGPGRDPSALVPSPGTGPSTTPVRVLASLLPLPTVSRSPHPSAGRQPVRLGGRPGWVRPGGPNSPRKHPRK